MKINRQQQQAIFHKDVPLMISAGPGSGKSFVLVQRVKYILDKGTLPNRVLVTTFTNKATDEVVERLNTLIGKSKVKNLRIGTFHSLCYKIYRKLLENIHPGKPLPKILKGGGQWMVMQKILKDNNCASKDIKYALSKIGYWKNQGFLPEQIAEQYKPELILSDHTKSPNLGVLKAYEEYEKYLKKSNSIDFDCILIKTFNLLNGNLPQLKKVQKRIEYITVDETHDLCNIQFQLLDLLLGKNRKITLVYDSDQSMYKFRGAEVKYLNEFQIKYNADVTKLEQNYRSTKTIVELGNKLIKHNSGRIDKHSFTENPQGQPPGLLISTNPDNEAERILKHIEKLILYEGYDFSDIAILYRINSQSRAIVDEFVVNNIPHKVHSKYGFYERSEIKDIISYIKILLNPFMAEAEDFRRIINKPTRYLGAKFISDIEELQDDYDYETFWEALNNSHKINLKPFQVTSVGGFIKDIKVLNSRIKSHELFTSEIIDLIFKEIGYLKWIEKENFSSDPDDDSSLNVKALHDGANRFPEPQAFLTYVDSLKNKKEEDNDDCVQLMTVHGSKGLQYPVVFIIGLSECLLPYFKSVQEEGGLEEERRICYVAVTRAEERVYLSAINGKFHSKMVNVPSRFIKEMGVELPPLGEGVEYN